jgi:hypothetical protein
VRRLPHPRHALAQGGHGVVGERYAGYRDVAAAGRDQACDERQQGGLAGAAGARQCDMLAGGDAKLETFEYLLRFARPGEMQVVDGQRGGGVLVA